MINCKHDRGMQSFKFCMHTLFVFIFLLSSTLSFSNDIEGDVLNSILMCTADAGTITASDSSVPLINNLASLSALPDGNQVVPTGYQTTYVLTKGAGLVIQQLNTLPIFTVTSSGDYTIHTLVYHPNSLDLNTIVIGISTGFDLNNLLIQGGGTICGGLDVVGAPITVTTNPNCTAAAGTVSAPTNRVLLSNGVANINALSDGNQVVPIGYQTAYILTKGNSLVVEQTRSISIFTVTTEGKYRIHPIVYDPNTIDLSTFTPGVTTAIGIDTLLIQGGGTICGSLDLNGALITVVDPLNCLADAGTVTPVNSSVLLSGGSVSLGVTPDGNQVVPGGSTYRYLLTKGLSQVIQDVSISPSFTVANTGEYKVHILVYNPNLLDLSMIVPGLTVTADINVLLIQGGGTFCGALDLTGEIITVVDPQSCLANAGTIATNVPLDTLDDGSATISALPDGNQSAPLGYVTSFILTKGNDLTILQLNGTPFFTVSEEGEYTIHTMVFDPNLIDLSFIIIGTTSVYDLEPLMIQGGGTICASIDVTGAPIEVLRVDCLAKAGAITAITSSTILENGSSLISALPDGNQIITSGYQAAYVLTKDTGLVIEQLASIPFFTVNSVGDYAIHTLVYNSNTLDVSAIQLGITTGFDVNALLIQGGGLICASLDTIGAVIQVNDPQSCTADAGTITPDASPVLLNNGMAMISATSSGNQVIPGGYQVGYVLTKGENLVIEQLATSPFFTVNSEGDYTIHTLVYDPMTLDLTTVVPSTTTGFDVNALLIQGGGSVCGSLDMLGASIEVLNTQNCAAAAGTITANASPVTVTGKFTEIGATPDGSQVIPVGYVQLFVLTEGPNSVVKQLQPWPIFYVVAAGNYKVHTLIYHPNSLDLSVVELGTTTALDLNGTLIQGGGVVCGALDVTGTSIQVSQ